MEHDKTEISIIVPVYNGKAFIKKAYDSLIAQEIADLEILFVDNNSTDGSILEIKKLQGLDPRIKFLEQKIQGAAAARNKGLENAKGQYIYMFDVDDQIYPGALKAMQ